MSFQKLDPVTWGPNVTLSDLWQRWMSANGLHTAADAKRALVALEIRGSEDLDSWLRDEPTNALLTTSAGKITELTGVDIDGWLVCEAKKQLIARAPELADRVDFATYTSRGSIIDELNAWGERYGNRFLLGIQIGAGSNELLRKWLEKVHLPSVEPLSKMIELLVRGPINANTRIDLVYALICRVIFDADPQTIFPGAGTFHDACRLMLSAYKGHTPNRVAKEIGLGGSATQNLLSWDPNKEPDPKLPYETVEGVIRALLKRSYPEHVARFDELRKTYRTKQKQGIWEVAEPLRLGSVVGGREAPKEPQERRPIKPTRPVSTSPVATTPQPPVEKKGGDDLAERLAHGHELMAGALRGKRYIEETAAEITPNAQAQIGELIEDVRHCLTRASFARRPGERLNPEQIETVREAIERLRKVIVFIVSFGDEHIQRDVRPILGPELFELFLGTRGLQLLLDNPEAFDIINAERETARLLQRGK